MNSPDALNSTLPQDNNHNKLRGACNSCHKSKVRCSGGKPCIKCRDCNIECQYSYMAKLGKPKGSRNKKTLAAAASKRPVELSRTSSVGSYSTQSNDMPLLSRSTSNSLGDLPESDANLHGQLDSEIFGMNFFDPRMEDFLGDTSGALDATNYHTNATDSTTAYEVGPMDDLTRNDEHNSCLPGWQQFRSCNTLPETACSCLKKLTDHLCHLNVIERKQSIICLDTMLSETDLTLKCAETVLECHLCRLDSKVMLLIMTVLQTVLNWVLVEHQQKEKRSDLPPIYFGGWRVSTANGHLIKDLLTSGIVGTSESVVSTLRLRMDEITLKAHKDKMHYGFMDSESLQETLRRLTRSIQKLREHI